MSEEDKIESHERLTALTKERIDELFQLGEMHFFGVGDHYGLEQLLPDGAQWDDLRDDKKESFLRDVGEILEVDLLDYSGEEVVRQYHEEGVPDTPTGNGAEVDVLATNNYQLEIHVMRYANPDLGTRYDLVGKRIILVDTYKAK